MARTPDWIERALDGVAGSIVPAGVSAWTFSIANGAAVPASLRMSGDWIELAADLPGRPNDVAHPLAWLRVNAHLHRSARVATGGSRGPHLIADVAVQDIDRQDRGDRVRSACLDLTDAIHCIRDGFEDEAPPCLPAQVTSDEVARVCAEAGWRCAIDADGCARVSVHTPLGALPARIERIDASSSGLDCVRLDLIDLAGHSPVSQRAAAALLLRVSGAVRFVSASAHTREDRAIAALVSRLEGPLDSALDRALSALALAAQSSVRELHALRDARLSTEYLAIAEALPDNPCPNSTQEDCTCLQPQ